MVIDGCRGGWRRGGSSIHEKRRFLDQRLHRNISSLRIIVKMLMGIVMEVV
jgi:hypothetical protein